MVVAGCFEHSKHIIQHAEWTHSFVGFIKRFSLIHDWKIFIVGCLRLTVSWNWQCFWDSNRWMLYVLHNRIERTFAFTAAGICTFWVANNKKFLFKLTTKILLYSWLAGLAFLMWHYLLKIPTQESKCKTPGKHLACWKRLAWWKRLDVLKAPDSVAFTAWIIM